MRIYMLYCIFICYTVIWDDKIINKYIHQILFYFFHQTIYEVEERDRKSII